MNKSNRIILAIAFLFAAAGFLLPFWPLEVAGIVGAALLGHPIFACAVGILLDIAYGTPVGLAHYIFFPFTLLAAASVLARIAGARYLIGKTPQERI